MIEYRHRSDITYRRTKITKVQRNGSGGNPSSSETHRKSKAFVEQGVAPQYTQPSVSFAQTDRHHHHTQNERSHQP